MSEHLKRLLVDIRFYLLLFFVLRMYGITDAPLESSHSWRQVFTNMIAIESVANQQHEFVIKNENKVWLNLESNLEPLKSNENLIITSGRRDMRNMYYADGKG